MPFRALATVASITLLMLVLNACQGQRGPEQVAVPKPIPATESVAAPTAAPSPSPTAAPATNTTGPARPSTPGQPDSCNHAGTGVDTNVATYCRSGADRSTKIHRCDTF